jgi:hypothetical protein
MLDPSLRNEFAEELGPQSPRQAGLPSRQLHALESRLQILRHREAAMRQLNDRL